MIAPKPRRHEYQSITTVMSSMRVVPLSAGAIVAATVPFGTCSTIRWGHRFDRIASASAAAVFGSSSQPLKLTTRLTWQRNAILILHHHHHPRTWAMDTKYSIPATVTVTLSLTWMRTLPMLSSLAVI